jgi:hypothetical protein
VARKTGRRTWRDVLRFSPTPISQATVRKYYDQYRLAHGIPLRCDNVKCHYHVALPEWNGKPLPLILDHVDGVRSDNRPKRLRYLCPNCDAQLPTRGGRNKGRVEISSGGYALKSASGQRNYNLVIEGGNLAITGHAPTVSVRPNKRLKLPGARK